MPKKGKKSKRQQDDSEDDADADENTAAADPEAAAAPAANAQKKDKKKKKKGKQAQADDAGDDTAAATDVASEEGLVIVEVVDVAPHPKLSASQRVVSVFDGDSINKVRPALCPRGALSALCVLWRSVRSNGGMGADQAYAAATFRPASEHMPPSSACCPMQPRS